MKNFTICFSFRGQSHIASVYASTVLNVSYAIYFTDVELILEFGSMVEYTIDGNLQLSKSLKENSVLLLREALTEQLDLAA